MLLAVVSASLLGSVHCAGMCGPFALFAASVDGRIRLARLISYHLGRLSTYVIIGLVVGLTGTAVNASGEAIGLPYGASQAAGLLLILLAAWKLWPRSASSDITPGLIAQTIAKTRPAIARLPQWLRPAAIGAVTVLLPCGWLYAFAIVAAGSGGVVPAILVMSSFWVGTLPWLSGMTWLAKPLSARPRVSRVVTATLLAAAGLYTMTGRAAADFQPLIDSARVESRDDLASGIESSGAATLDAVTQETPPCCRHLHESNGGEVP